MTLSEISSTSYRPQDDVPPTGFSFDNVHRNAMLLQQQKQRAVAGAAAGVDHDVAGFAPRIPKAKKTGTTIAGFVFAGGVVLGADTRATNGEEVAEKDCKKIDYVAPNIYCAGAGTAADTSKTNALISSQLELLRMDTHSSSRVVTAVTLLKRLLFRYQGHIGAHLILAGCDVNGPHLYQIHAGGTTCKLPYSTMGSGCMAAMAVLESSWRPDLAEPEAISLIQRAITAGIFNDLGSGSNCDMCIIRTDGTVTYQPRAVQANPVAPLRDAVRHSQRLTMRPGVTPVLKTQYQAHPVNNPATLADVTVTEMEVEE